MSHDRKIVIGGKCAELLAASAAVGIVDIILALNHGSLLLGLADELAARAASPQAGLDASMRGLLNDWVAAIRVSGAETGDSATYNIIH